MELPAEFKPSCEVLCGHLENYLSRFLVQVDLKKGLVSIDELPSLMEEIGSLNIYDQVRARLTLQHKIPANQVSEIFETIEASSLIYVASTLTGHMPAEMRDDVNRIKQLACTAKRFKSLIENADPYFLDVLQMVDHVEDKQMFAPNAKDYFDDLIKKLERVIEFESGFTETKIAKVWMLGTPHRKANIGLYSWVADMYGLWTNDLGRTMQHDPKGVSGRKRCLEFMYDCFEHVHPALEYHVIENVFTRIQKDMKTRDGLSRPELGVLSSMLLGDD